MVDNVKIINQISRLSSRDSILIQMKKDLLSASGFGYDYICISWVNLITKRIETTDICDRLKLKLDQKNKRRSCITNYKRAEDSNTLLSESEVNFWMQSSNYSLHDSDILINVTKELIPVIVIKDKVYGENNSITKVLKIP